MQDIEREKEFLAYWAGDSFKSLGKTKLIIFLKTSSVVNASRESFHFRNPSNFVLYSEVWAIHSIDKFVKVAQPEEAGQKSNNLGRRAYRLLWDQYTLQYRLVSHQDAHLYLSEPDETYGRPNPLGSAQGSQTAILVVLPFVISRICGLWRGFSDWFCDEWRTGF